VIGLILVLGGAVAFVFGGAAIARAEDLQGLYWLTVGVCSTHAAVQMVRPRAG
jgi:hypothetical protein